MKDIAVGQVGQINEHCAKVIDEVDDLVGLTINDRFDGNEVCVFETANFAEFSTHFQFSERANVNLSGNPSAVGIGVSSSKKGVAIVGEQGIEIVGGGAICDAPFQFIGCSVCASVPTIIEGGLVPKGFFPNHSWANALTAKVGQGAIGVDVAESLSVAVVAGIPNKNTRPVIVGGLSVVIACSLVFAACHFVGVANAVLVNVSCAITIANAEDVQFSNTVVHVITNAVAVCIGSAVPIADAKSVRCAHTVVYIITYAIVVCIGVTIAATNVNGVELIAIAIAVSSGNARTIANAAFIKGSYTIVYIVANAIVVRIACTGSAANAKGVELIPVAITIPRRDATATASAAFVELIAIAIAVASGGVGTAAFINFARTTAHTARIELLARAVINGCTRVVVACPLCCAAGNVCWFCAKAGDVRIGESGSRSHHFTVDAEAVTAISELTAHAISVAVIDCERVATEAELFVHRNRCVVVVCIGST